jgi:hypothetical protein
MKLGIALLLQMLLLALPVHAAAETTLVDLDSAPGAYSTWKVTDLPSNSIQFTATYATLHTHEEWAPSYSIILSDSSGNALNVSGAFQGSDEPRATTTLLKGETPIATLKPALQLVLKRAYNVKLSWSGSKVSFDVDGLRTSYDVGFTPSSIQVISSTGELELKGITFGK